MKKTYFLLPLLIPALAFAQAQDAFDILRLVAGWISSAIPALLGFIVLIFFWNMTQFILHAGDEREREKYKQFMVWGVVGMFLIISFWGIIYMITNSFFGSTANPVLGDPQYVDKDGRQL